MHQSSKYFWCHLLTKYALYWFTKISVHSQCSRFSHQQRSWSAQMKLIKSTCWSPFYPYMQVMMFVSSQGNIQLASWVSLSVHFRSICDKSITGDGKDRGNRRELKRDNHCVLFPAFCSPHLHVLSYKRNVWSWVNSWISIQLLQKKKIKREKKERK